MIWLLEHTEVITISSVIGIFIFIVGGITLMVISGDTPEASELQGAPETLGDFPPLPPMSLGKLAPELQNISVEELEKILKGEQ